MSSVRRCHCFVIRGRNPRGSSISRKKRILSSKSKYIRLYGRYHEKAAQARELLAQIPEDAPVRSSTFFVPQLSMRDEIYLLDSGHEAGYAVVDLRANYEKNLDQTLHSVDGILVPGGFGNRGTEGMILAAQYARVHKIPYLGICLGMQMAIVEFARHVLGYEDANSIELAPETTHPVIALMPDQEDVEDLGGTLRLGSYPCVLAEGSRSYELFGKKEIQERHRHRYEVNNAFRKELDEKGMSIVGTSPDAHIVEMIEIAGHPFFVGTQGHPEFKSRPNHAHPLFRGFVQAAVDKKTAEEAAMKG